MKFFFFLMSRDVRTYTSVLLLFFTEEAVDVPDLSAYNEGPGVAAAKAVNILRLTKSFNQEQHGLIREYLIVNLSLWNANRSGGIIHLTKTIVDNAKVRDVGRQQPMYVFKVGFLLGYMSNFTNNPVMFRGRVEDLESIQLSTYLFERN